MRGLLVFVVAVGIGLKMGWDYLNSENFQAYGDRTKAEWTCKVDFWLGEYMTVLSQYQDAAKFFSRSADRCPKTEIGEESAFELAHALETGGKRAAAVDAYRKFVEQYPDSPRAKLAEKSADILTTS